LKRREGSYRKVKPETTYTEVCMFTTWRRKRPDEQGKDWKIIDIEEGLIIAEATIEANAKKYAFIRDRKIRSYIQTKRKQ
jgi:hypothetical protein